MRIILLGYLGILSFFDWREKKIPVILPAAGIAAAVGYTVWEMALEPESLGWRLSFACLGMLPGAFLTAVARLSGKAGCGDGVVLMNLGMLLGYRICLTYLCFSVLFAALWSAGLLVLRRADRHTTLPYLPFLTAVYLAGMLVV